MVVPRSPTHYLGDIIFTSGEAWHQVTIHFLHENHRYSPVALQFCCFWTYATYIRFISNTVFAKGWGKGHCFPKGEPLSHMAKFKYQGIEIHHVIFAQKQFKKVQGEMEVNILAWWNPDVHWTKVNCNNHIINLIVAAVLSPTGQSYKPLENANTEEGCQHRTHTQDTETKVWWFQFKEKEHLSKHNVCLKYRLGKDLQRLRCSLHRPSFIWVWFPKMQQEGWGNHSFALSPVSPLSIFP